MPKGQQVLLAESKSMLKGLLPDARFSLQPPSAWEPDQLLKDIQQGLLFPDKEIPGVLRDALAAPEQHKGLISAFAGMRDFLKRSMLEDAVVKVGSVERLPGQGTRSDRAIAMQGVSASEEACTVGDEASGQASHRDDEQCSTMVLDASALSNLEVRFSLLFACMIYDIPPPVWMLECALYPHVPLFP